MYHSWANVCLTLSTWKFQHQIEYCFPTLFIDPSANFNLLLFLTRLLSGTLKFMDFPIPSPSRQIERSTTIQPKIHGQSKTTVEPGLKSLSRCKHRTACREPSKIAGKEDIFPHVLRTGQTRPLPRSVLPTQPWWTSTEIKALSDTGTPTVPCAISKKQIL